MFSFEPVLILKNPKLIKNAATSFSMKDLCA